MLKYLFIISIVFTAGFAVNAYAQPASDCCAPEGNGTPGCDDAACETLICGQDPFCCDVQWDGICADAAIAQCEVCIGGDGDGDGDGDEEDRIVSAPTMNQWGMIAVLTVLFIVAVLNIARKVRNDEI